MVKVKPRILNDKLVPQFFFKEFNLGNDFIMCEQG